jgi:putative transposase
MNSQEAFRRWPSICAELAADALQMALQQHQPAPGLICHSDRGSQGGFN